MPRFRDPFDEPPPRRDEDEEREKPSWRELDARRDRSYHVQDKPKIERQPAIAKRGQALAKEALDELFTEKKDKDRKAAWKKVHEASGKLFAGRARAYVEKYGMPKTWDDLLRLLDHPDSQFFESILDRVMELAVHESPVRIDLLVGKLRVLKMTHEEPELLAKMEGCLAKLSEGRK
ncbi:MAG TPA: hypothetical protein VI895_06130 [Bdellovibrionota bacterium]|nr:hypothetical protein [Bdellovibrionota bacterium]